MYESIYALEKCIYKGNINSDFFKFCLLKKISLFLYIPLHIIYFILYYLNFIDRKKYFENYFAFFKKFNKKETTKISKLFWDKKIYKINPIFLIKQDYEKSLIICDTLNVILKPLFNKIKVKKIISLNYDFDKKRITNSDILLDCKKEIINKTKQLKFDFVYAPRESQLLLYDLGKNNYIVKNKKVIPYKDNRIIEILKKTLFSFLIISLISLVLTFINFAFSLKVSDVRNIMNYFDQFDVLILNFIPIFLMLLLIYFISSRLWVSILLVSTITIIFSFINKIKLVFRDEPFLFSDLKLFKEAFMMTSRYEIKISFNIIILIIFILLVTFILFKKHKLIYKKTTRFLMTIVVLIIMIVGYLNIYTDKKIYNSVGDQSKINIWSETQQFQTRGFIYPFIYSSTSKSIEKPINYNEKEIENQIVGMENKNIEENQKVNIIAIMLEAHNDFSKYGIEFNEPVYDSFQTILNNSYHGEIVTNVFGGGTIDTERSFLTGYNTHPNYRTNTNSFVWYLKNQGYYTEAMHPCYGYFYNRKNSNDYIGFDNFDYYENKYSNIQTDFLLDSDFFKEIISGYENNKLKNQPYFNFSVTYQNHGPYYEGLETTVDYLKRNNDIDDATYNLLNNYFWRIKSTNDALLEMLNYFENESEPVIVVLFGDHNPYLGENNKGYSALDIDMNSNSIDSFLNTYSTDYIFWANEEAKQVTGKSFNEKGTDISPMFLMTELFEYINWEGNEYMQTLSSLKNEVNVISKNVYKTNEEYTTALPEELNGKIINFNKTQYYFATNFIK